MCAIHEAKPWACLSKGTAANGEVKETAIGDACLECWKLWDESWRYQYDSFDKFSEAYHTSKDVAAKIDKSLGVARLSGTADFNQEEVQRSFTLNLNVERTYKILNESELRTLLGVPRLLKSHTKNLPVVQVPSESGSGAFEKCFAFVDDENPWRTARVSSVVAASVSSIASSRDKSLHAEHGRSCQASVWKGDESGGAALATASLRSVFDFLAGHGISYHGGSRKPKPESSSSHVFGDDDEDDDASDDEQAHEQPGATLVGPAAQAYADRGPHTEHLVSPGKYRPQVPSFAAVSPRTCGARSDAGSHRHGGAADNQSIVSAASGRPASSARSSGGGDDDEDTIGDDFQDDAEGTFGAPSANLRVSRASYWNTLLGLSVVSRGVQQAKGPPRTSHMLVRLAARFLGASAGGVWLVCAGGQGL